MEYTWIVVTLILGTSLALSIDKVANAIHNHANAESDRNKIEKEHLQLYALDLENQGIDKYEIKKVFPDVK